jgi:hypothetical protein
MLGLPDRVDQKIITREGWNGLDLETDETASTEEPQDVKKQSWLDCSV